MKTLSTDLEAVVLLLREAATGAKDYFRIAPDLEDWLREKLRTGEIWLNHVTGDLEGLVKIHPDAIADAFNNGERAKIQGALSQVIGAFTEEKALKYAEELREIILRKHDSVFNSGVDLVSKAPDGSIILTEAKYAADNLGADRLSNLYDSSGFNPKKYLGNLDGVMRTEADMALREGKLRLRLFLNSEQSGTAGITRSVIDEIADWNARNPGFQVEVVLRDVQSGLTRTVIH